MEMCLKQYRKEVNICGVHKFLKSNLQLSLKIIPAHAFEKLHPTDACTGFCTRCERVAGVGPAFKGVL